MLLGVVELDATLKCSELCSELSGRPAIIQLPIPWLSALLSQELSRPRALEPAPVGRTGHITYLGAGLSVGLCPLRLPLHLLSVDVSGRDNTCASFTVTAHVGAVTLRVSSTLSPRCYRKSNLARSV